MTKSTVSNKKVIVFRLQEEEYAVSVASVGSIERMLPITRVPQTASFVKGVINLRGVVTPVIDLRTRFGMEATEVNEATRIIIVYMGDTEVGLVVDSANDVVDVPADAIEPKPEIIGTVDTDYIEGVVKLESRLLILLDLSKVLTSEEMKTLNMMEGQ
jgi:purine-binding chemotaxis protein CheW